MPLRHAITTLSEQRGIPMRSCACLAAVLLCASFVNELQAQPKQEKPAEPETWNYTLMDSAQNIQLTEWKLDQSDLPETGAATWSVKLETLAGGKSDGVQLLTITHDDLTVSVIPTRGLNIYEVSSGDLRLGWDSPVKEIVHPKYINLDSRGGLGWLDGFNEWMVRCGLEFAGHPGLDEFITNTGDPGEMELTLHGKIGNIPASKLEVLIDKAPPHRIRVRGVVHERLFFGPKLRLVAEISTVPGEATLQIHDEVTNLGASKQEMQLIYHTNFGRVLLEKGAQVVAPVNVISPMNANAAKAIESWSTYQEPTPGFIEEVFLIHPYANQEGWTGVLLHNAPVDKACSIHWNVDELPYLTIWKNTVAEEDGYVTGLEPATGFPYNRKVEREAGRVPVLEPVTADRGSTRRFTLEFQLHTGQERVQQVIDQIRGYQGDRETIVNESPLVE